MSITSFGFNADEVKELNEFVDMCIEHDYNFTVGHDGDHRYVEVDDISFSDAEYWEEYSEDERTEDGDDDYEGYEECGNIEEGFNPYMGAYDFDC